jgi:S1-C subfamily serine protease
MSVFRDVAPDRWSAKAIDYCAKSGIMVGLPDGSFNPEGVVTREQLAVVMWKASLRDGTFTDVLPDLIPSCGMIMDGTKALGSCVCVKCEGGKSYLVTNNHVIQADTVTPGDTFIKSGMDNKPATLIKVDPINDLALLSIDYELQPCKIAASPAAIGSPVCVIGAPAGLDDSVSVGIISHLNRNEGKWFQTDSPINPGNSGGGIFNEAGELVGIAVAKQSDPLFDGLAYGIRLELVKGFIAII